MVTWKSIPSQRNSKCKGPEEEMARSVPGTGRRPGWQEVGRGVLKIQMSLADLCIVLSDVGNGWGFEQKNGIVSLDLLKRIIWANMRNKRSRARGEAGDGKAIKDDGDLQ